MLEISTEWEGLDAAFKDLVNECSDVVRGLTVEIFQHTLQMSPQSFGRYVSSWTYKVGSPDFYSNQTFVYEAEDQGYAEIKRKGDPEAIFAAMAHNKGRDKAFKLGDTVYFANGVDHGEGPYAQGIEDGTIKLRMVNLPGRPVTRAIDRAAAWFANDMNPSHAAKYKALRMY